MNLVRNLNKKWVLILFIVFILSGCGTAEETTPTAAPIADDFAPVVSATGKIIPEQSATLSTSAGGIIAEVLVKEGERVESGEVLVRLEGKEQLEASLSAAELELENAEYTLSELYDQEFDLLAAQARQSMEEAQDALDDLLNPELQQALALQAIADAEKRVEDAEERLSIVQSAADEADIDAAEAQVTLAKDALEKAIEDFEPYENKPEDNLVRANFKARLAAAQQAYDAAVRRLNALLSTGTEIDIAVAKADLATAQAQLLEAQRDWEDLKDGPDPVKVALLEAQIAFYKKEWERLENGPDPEDVALAEERLSNAEVQVAAARAALDDLELTAPFSGTISELHINESEWVAPGQPVLEIADLANLRVETTDLNEIDVSQIDVGDTATLTFDAIPDLGLKGTITHIAPKASEGAGVNYTVSIELDEIPDNLLWGMTVFVDIEIR